MKFITNAIFLTSALLATVTAAPSTSTTYQLRVNSANPSIGSSFLALKDSSTTTTPNALGIWSSGEPRSPYQLTLSTSPSDTRLYSLKGQSSQLILYGIREAMGFFSAPLGYTAEVRQGEAFYSDKFTFLGYANDDDLMLRHAQDFNTSGTDLPTGGAGSWRACKGDSEIDYQMYWYDGSSPLPIKNCEGVSLELVASTPLPTSLKPVATSAGTFLTGVTGPSSTTTGAFLTGVTGPSATATGGKNASSASGSPKQSSIPGSGSTVGTAGALIGLVVGSMILMV